MFQRYPETMKLSFTRYLALIENINSRVMEESESGKKAVCYVLACHPMALEVFTRLYQLNEGGNLFKTAFIDLNEE